jgi:hypothetical protein
MSGMSKPTARATGIAGKLVGSFHHSLAARRRAAHVPEVHHAK